MEISSQKKGWKTYVKDEKVAVRENGKVVGHKLFFVTYKEKWDGEVSHCVELKRELHQYVSKKK
jgi:hypothetical protein